MSNKQTIEKVHELLKHIKDWKGHVSNIKGINPVYLNILYDLTKAAENELEVMCCGSCEFRKNRACHNPQAVLYGNLEECEPHDNFACKFFKLK